MILLVPMLIEQGYAKTTGVARDNGPVDRHFSNIKYHLDFGGGFNSLHSLAVQLNGKREEQESLVMRKVSFQPIMDSQR